MDGRGAEHQDKGPGGVVDRREFSRPTGFLMVFDWEDLHGCLCRSGTWIASAESTARLEKSRIRLRGLSDGLSTARGRLPQSNR